MLDKQKQDLYCKFKNSIFGPNHLSNRSNTSNNNNPNNAQSSVSDTLQDPDQELILQRARFFIHKIRDHRHNKIRNSKSISSSDCFTKSMDTIIISPGTTIISTTSIKTAVWVDNQLCHPVALPQLPPLPMFLPHQSPHTFQPHSIQPLSTRKPHQQQHLLPACM